MYSTRSILREKAIHIKRLSYFVLILSKVLFISQKVNYMAISPVISYQAKS